MLTCLFKQYFGDVCSNLGVGRQFPRISVAFLVPSGKFCKSASNRPRKIQCISSSQLSSVPILCTLLRASGHT
jgi:hypothetical protein